MISLTDALQGVTRLFLDTAPVIYFVERHPVYHPRISSIFSQFGPGTIEAVTSSVTLAECLVYPIRLNLPMIRQDFVDLIVHGQKTHFTTVGEEQAIDAAELRARYGISLTDAFQVACALKAGCDAFLTNDAQLRRVTEIRMLIVDDLVP